MRKLTLTTLTALSAGALLGPPSAHAGPAASGPARCFYSRDWSGWTVTPDARSMYIRVGVRDVYRLDFATICSAAQGVGAHLVTRIRGSSLVCNPIDLDLKVADGNGFATACLVNRITPLSAEEAAALPKKLRP